MSSVWFIVPGVGKKIITSKQWQFYGITAEDSIWGPENGWSVPESSFSAMQLNILDGDSGFLLGQEDGPRTYPPPPGDMLNDEVSGFAYYIATKKLLEQLEDIGDVPGQIETLENDLNDAENDIIDIQGDVDDLSDTVGDLGTNLTSLTGVVSGKQPISTLATDVASVFHGSTSRTKPLNTDEIPLVGDGPKRISYADLVAGRVRPGTWQFEHCNNLSNFNSLHTRRRFLVTVKPLTQKLHIRNWDQLGGVWSTGTLSNVVASVGLCAKTSGEWNGQFTATPTQILTPTTLNSGANEIVVDVPTSLFQIEAFQQYTLGISWNATAQQVANGGGLHYYTTNPSDFMVANPGGLTRADNQGFLDIYWEFTYANNDTPSIVVVGNSLSWGGNVAGLANRGELDAWHSHWAMKNGGVVANLAVAGSWCAHYGASSPRWDVYDGMANDLDPDMGVLMGTSSSDVSGGADLATAKTNTIACVSKLKSKWPSIKVLATTLPPRIATTQATEIVRKQYNQWITGCPAGIDTCIDIEPALTDYGNQMALTVSTATSMTLDSERLPRLHPDVDSGDHEHWRATGHIRISDMVTLARKLVL